MSKRRRGFAASLWIWTSLVESRLAEESFSKVWLAGFDGIEIPMLSGRLDTTKISSWLSTSSGRLDPVIIGGGSAAFDTSSSDIEISANGKKYVKGCIAASEELNGSLVCGPLYSAVGKLTNYTELEREKSYHKVAEAFRELGRFAGDRGIKIALEPLCRYDTSLVNTTSDGRKLVDLVDRENVGLLLDTFHMNIEEKFLSSAIKSAGEKLFHFHACENDRGTPGSGQVNWGEVKKGLDEVNYDGLIAIESFTPFEREFATAMRVWRSLATSQDSIAIEGLSFLKSKLGLIQFR